MRDICESVELNPPPTTDKIKEECGLQWVHWRPVESVKIKTVFPPVLVNEYFPVLEHISQLF